MVEIAQPYSFLAGDGEMADLIRSYDWSKTSIGPINTWPQSLRTTLSIILHSKFPMFLFWGNSHICFYNDAYRPSFGATGKHPESLGKQGAEVWPEIWEIIYPQIQQVMDGGDSTWNEDQPMAYHRNGRLEEIYWTYSYSSVTDESGQIAGVFVTCTETTEKVNTLNKIEKSDQTFRNMIMGAPIAIGILKGPDFIVETANDKMLDIWGKTTDQIINKPIFEGLSEAKGQGLEELLSGVYTTGEKYMASERLIQLPREGKLEDKYISFEYSALYEAGVKNGVVVIAVDVTEQTIARKKIEKIISDRTRELSDANDSLQRSNRELEQFAYVASHDLQEPLRKIQAFGDILKSRYRDVIEQEGADLIDRMQSASDRMKILIDDLLSYSRVSSSNVNYEKTDVNAIIAEVINDLETAIKEKHAIVNIADMPPINADPVQLRQLFQNIIGNALKFSKLEEPPVIQIKSSLVNGKDASLHVSNADKNNDFLQIEISDNGIGFDQQYAERIFQLFQRLHGRMEYPGSGMGLSIVKKVVDNHNGYIEATSTPGLGAAFTILLPHNPSI